MPEQQGRREEQQGREAQSDREGGLIELFRRVMAPRPPAVLVMDRDGRLRRAVEVPREGGE